MISLYHFRHLLIVSTIILVAACGGGSGSSTTDAGSGFNTSNTNTKPQTSSTDSVITSSAPASGSEPATLSSSSNKSSSSKTSIASSSSSKLSTSSSRSSKSTAVADLTPPTIPANFKAETVLFDRVILTWESSTDASNDISYKIYRDQIQLETIQNGTNIYYDFDVALSKSYTYSISAGDTSGNWSEPIEIKVQIPANANSSNTSTTSSTSSTSSKSSAGADLTKPTAPEQVTKINAFSTQVDISWAAASDNIGVTSYKIYRDSILLKTVTADILSYSDKSVLPNLSYWYGVSAGDAAGNWSAQKLLNVKTPNVLIAGSATLKWLPPTERVNLATLPTAEIGGYEIRYKTIQENNYSYKSVSNTSNQITITDLTGDYSFEIAAFDTNGLYSNFIAIKPQ